MNKLYKGLGLLMVVAFAMAGCAPAATPAPTEAMPAATEAMPATEAPTAAMPATEAPTEAMPAETIDCAGAQSGDSISMLYQFTAEEETKLSSILKPLVDACGIVFNPETTRDQALLDTRVQAGTPPDVVIWPSVSVLTQYKDLLKPMDSLGAVKDNYIPGAIDPGVVDGAWLGLPVKTDIKSIIWYSPTNFQALGYTVPTTWDDLNTLVDQMASDGNVPWSMGFASGDATGWTGSDFIQDILLVQQGPQYVMSIISGDTPYNDAGVKQAYETYGKWATDPKYTVGGAQGTLSTAFSDAILKVFSDPPEAMMVKQSGFAGGTITDQHKDFKYGTDYDFFVIPGLKGLQGGSDFMMAFSDKPAVKALVTYLSSPLGGKNWAAATFALSPNKGGQGNFTDPALIIQADAFYSTQGLTPDIGDSIPGGFATAEWTAIVNYVNGGDLDAQLANVAAAQKAALGK
jgi:alpha-glucoside transport system substrate-binding protein